MSYIYIHIAKGCHAATPATKLALLASCNPTSFMRSINVLRRRLICCKMIYYGSHALDGINRSLKYLIGIAERITLLISRHHLNAKSSCNFLFILDAFIQVPNKFYSRIVSEVKNIGGSVLTD